MTSSSSSNSDGYEFGSDSCRASCVDDVSDENSFAVEIYQKKKFPLKLAL
jgi:hypothetical protein